MKVLLDENLDQRLAAHLKPFHVTTVTTIGWSGLRNGVLLQKMINQAFTHLITADRNIRHQQNEAMLVRNRISVIILVGDNAVQTHVKHLRLIRFAIKKHKPGFNEIRYNE